MTYPDYERNVKAFFEKEGLRNLSDSPYKCPDCDVQFKAGTCPKCKRDAGSFPVEPYYSGRPCECCGETDGGNRYDANGYSDTQDAILEFVVCPTCIYYAEYGEAPDGDVWDAEEDDEEDDDFDDDEEDDD